ncbi:MAG: transketolase [Candidatus Omnitrophica bacterium]|jgi:transketolase|nr:transketolase [Candidatus Omnitrophota bacterium]
MQNKINFLKMKANWVRKQVLESIMLAGKGHLGGTFSCIDILVGLYYAGILRVDPQHPRWEDRDRFVVGKGHACLAFYHIWIDLGFLDASELENFAKNKSKLGGQLNISTPGVEYNSGSLGHAVGIAAGMALAAKMNAKKYKTIFLIGDGESAEGSIWESAMFASKHKLNNLIGIIDRNRLSVTDVIEEDDGSGRLDCKFEACGWKAINIDGHCFPQILSAFDHLEQLQQPLIIIADTVKGKGVSFMENGIKWHHSIPSREEFELAKRELEREI